MFHYNGRPISKQEMTEILADREAAIILAKAKREREKDEVAIKQKRRDLLLKCVVGLFVVVALGVILL